MLKGTILHANMNLATIESILDCFWYVYFEIHTIGVKLNFMKSLSETTSLSFNPTITAFPRSTAATGFFYGVLVILAEEGSELSVTNSKLSFIPK